MVLRGVVRGQTIEFTQPLPFTSGEQVEVSVSALQNGEPPLGSPARILAALRAAPAVDREAVDELERIIEESHLPESWRGARHARL
jgi:hypothetical protein